MIFLLKYNKMNSKNLLEKLQQKGTPEKAAILSKFFKTGKGQYGEGDKFLGLPVPLIRETIRPFRNMPMSEILELLHSEWHEAREAALFIMAWQFGHSSEKEQETIFKTYIANTEYINNWDLVDLSCPAIVGGWLLERDRSVLHRLAKSKLLWDRRIAMVSCLKFIRNGENRTAFEIAEMLLGDKEDLMHKAVGWMLRETGKYCSEADQLVFLEKNYLKLPRTALRYAIEKFPLETRRQIMRGIFKK